jgi:membrane protease YdiL (CAAX protease family)
LCKQIKGCNYWDGENLPSAVPKVLLVYFSVAVIIFSSGYFFRAENESIASIPVLLSVLLIIPIYIWCKTSNEKTEFSKETNGRDKNTVLSWIFMLFILALSVRIPSVLLFGMPYEKTPLIYLIILTVLIIEKADVSVFGFKTRNIGKSLLFGFLFSVILGGLASLSFYLMIYFFTSQVPVQSYNVLPFLLTMPFMTLCVGISEEGLFRGYMQTHLERFYSSKQAIVIQAILFGVWHFVWGLNPFDPVYMLSYVGGTFLVGLLFGYFYSKTRNLAPLVFAHGLFDSFPAGIMENQSALDAFQTISPSFQGLTWILPYIISAVLTLLFIKYLVKEV